MKTKLWLSQLLIIGCIGGLAGCTNMNACNTCRSTVTTCTTCVQQPCYTSCCNGYVSTCNKPCPYTSDY